MTRNPGLKLISEVKKVFKKTQFNNAKLREKLNEKNISGLCSLAARKILSMLHPKCNKNKSFCQIKHSYTFKRGLHYECTQSKAKINFKQKHILETCSLS